MYSRTTAGLIALALLALSADPSSAQRRSPRHPRPTVTRHASIGAGVDKALSQLKAATSLTTEQQAQAKPILQQSAQAAAAIAKDKSLTKEEKAAKLKEIQKSCRSQIEALLTPEQKAKLAKAKSDPLGGVEAPVEEQPADGAGK